MPDATVVEAGRSLVDASPVVGAFLVLVMAALVWVVYQWLATLKALDAEKDARLDDAKAYAKDGEATRNAMAANTSAIQSILAVVKDRGERA